jgi:hypothetical protein
MVACRLGGTKIRSLFKKLQELGANKSPNRIPCSVLIFAGAVSPDAMKLARGRMIGWRTRSSQFKLMNSAARSIVASSHHPGGPLEPPGTSR